MISLNKEVCSDLAGATRREWIETNGIGGYSSSTVSGINTRRYHGILVAAAEPPLGRTVLLSKFDEFISVGETRIGLSANKYPGTVYPDGFLSLVNFRLDPYPVWTYEAAGILIERRLFMPHGKNTVACSWEVISRNGNEDKVSLELLPLVAFRDYHRLGTERRDKYGSFEAVGGRVVVGSGSDAPDLFFSADGARAEATGFWYENFEYEAERERGFDFTESLFQPFSLRFDLSAPARVIVSSEQEERRSWEDLEAVEVRRRAELAARTGTEDETVRRLALAADQFIVRRGKGRTVIAGYPWFSDWGRDTMIALPGLTLAAGRPELAKDVLLEFANHVSEGMLPNRFPDEGEEPEYNTVDATLWYFEAVRAYLQETGDLDTVGQRLYGALSDIVNWHVRGTRYNIKLDEDGLLRAGEEGVQLTWMDARVGDFVVTPRGGKPVEIQALWYNALRTMQGLAKTLGRVEDENRFDELASNARRSFRNKFWNAERDCLYDVISDDKADPSIRPNQILAASLFHTMLSKERARKVVRAVEAELLTPFGLRSLAPSDPAYIARYEGGPHERDSAYHQGTVWAWLMGPFIDALRRVSPQNKKTETRVDEILKGIRAHLADAGLGQVSEIFDADPPHEPRGCFAQAWSVAELLRVLRT
ncbi:MAG: glycogen debranching enzyme family protein [Acidobacteriota bacterium]|nr:MAG: glycogen debranching enzyme family protein [Acidobacteriota bacterium]